MTGEGQRGGENHWYLHSVLTGFLLGEGRRGKSLRAGFPCSRPWRGHNPSGGLCP